MFFKKKNKIIENKLYSKILFLSRNKLFYKELNLADTFNNRITLIFIHISFLFIKLKEQKNNVDYKQFNQKMFDFVFNKIDENMRELGYGDTKVNKDMKLLIKRFYNILKNTEMYKNNDTKKKVNFLSTYLDKISLDKNINITGLVDYFNKYQAFCFDLSPDSVLKGNFNFNYKQRL